MRNNFSCGKRIRDLRQERGLSQERLALIADITPAYLGQLERGVKNPTVSIIERICRALGVSMADFFSVYTDCSTGEDDIGRQILSHLNGLTDEERMGFLSLIKDVLQIRQMGIGHAVKGGPQ